MRTQTQLNDETKQLISCCNANRWSPSQRATLTQVVGHEVGGEALGPMAHGCVIVRVPAEHQHGAAHDDGCVQVAEEATVLQDGPEK